MNTEANEKSEKLPTTLFIFNINKIYIHLRFTKDRAMYKY